MSKQMNSPKKSPLFMSKLVLQTLSGFMSTIYGQSMVAKGDASIVTETLRVVQDILKNPSTKESVRTTVVDDLLWKMSYLLEEIQHLSEVIGEKLSELDALEKEKDAS